MFGLIVGCAEPGSTEAPSEEPDWSLEGCVVREEGAWIWDGEERFACASTLFGPEPNYDDWLVLSEDCLFDGGDWQSRRKEFDENGCATFQETSDFSGGEGWVRTTSSECNSHGDPVFDEVHQITVDSEGGVSESEHVVTHTYRYDEADRMVERISSTAYVWDAEAEMGRETHTWTWDAAGRIESVHQEGWNSYSEWDSITVNAYDEKDRLATATYASVQSYGDGDDWEANWVLNYVWDDLDRLTEVSRTDLELEIEDYREDYGWLDDTPWIQTRRVQWNGDGRDNEVSEFSYDCPE